MTDSSQSSSVVNGEANNSLPFSDSSAENLKVTVNVANATSTANIVNNTLNKDVVPSIISNSLTNKIVDNPFTDLSTNVDKELSSLNVTVVNNEVSKKSEQETKTEKADREAQEWRNSLGLSNRNEDRVFESMSGSNTTVLFEFPNYSATEGSIYMLMRSLVSVSVSTARAKIPVIHLGQSTVNGFALGTKTVAGSIIKALTYSDEISKVIELYTSKSLADKNKTIMDLGSKTQSENMTSSKYNITQKEFDSIMRDDILPFNIYTFSYSEYSGMEHKCLMNCIYGCTIINEGVTLSIENLITEQTISYVAKYASLGIDPTKDYQSMPTNDGVLTGSALLKAGKR